MWGIIISIGALVVAGIAAVYAKQSADGSRRSAVAAEAVDRRERTPQLRLILDNPVEAPCDRVIYRLRNEGPQDLDSVTVYRPKPPDRITYPIAATGKMSWVDDEVDLGAVALTKEVRFTLCCSAAEELPEFLVRIECAAGDDTWVLTLVLPSPRPERDPLGPAPHEARDSLLDARKAFEEVGNHSGADKRFFLDESRKHIPQVLEDNAKRVGDRDLQERLRAVASIWNECWREAPVAEYVHVLGAPRDPARSLAYATVDLAGQRGLEATEAALARLTLLGG